MAVSLEVLNGNGTILGGPGNLKGYTVQEDATPIDVSDSSGTVGTMSIQADVDSDRVDGSILFMDNTIRLNDDSVGTTTAVVSSTTEQDGELTINAEGALFKLTATRQVPPFNGTLIAALTYYLSLCGVTSEIVIDPSFTRQVAFPGWYGSVWDHLKQICSAEQIEIAWVSNQVVFRKLRQFEAITYRDSSVTRTVERGDTAQTIEIYLYFSAFSNHSCAFPVGAYTEDFMWAGGADIISINAGDIQVTSYDINASLSAVDQPVCVLAVSNIDKSASKYSVIDKDGNPVDPGTWNAAGGSVKVEIDETSTTLHVTVIGPSLPSGPYQLAWSNTAAQLHDSDQGKYPTYSSLRICGSGTFYRKELHTYQTSAHIVDTPTLVGTTVDNPYVNTYSQLQDCAVTVIGHYAGATQTLDVTTTGINRIGVNGSYRYPTFQDFDLDNPGTPTFDTFDIRWAGQSWSQFDDYYVTLVQSDFDNQAFGNVAGARVLKDQSWYRIDTAQHTEVEETYTATGDTIFSDFDAVWTTADTFADFDARWEDFGFNEFDRIPLWVFPPVIVDNGGLGTTYPDDTLYPGNGTYPGFSLNGADGDPSVGYPGVGYPGADNVPGE